MGKVMDLTQRQFGRLVVVRYLGQSMWECKCTCGKIKSIHSYSLRNGSTKSCGCIRRDIAIESKLNCLVGNTYGHWEVLSYLGKSMWECRCSCGIIKAVKAQSLKYNKSTSCGHDTTGLKDLTGRIINEWKILTYNGRQEYYCQCIICGAKELFKAYVITNKLIGICECSRVSNKLLDLVGMTFGELTVLRYDKNNKWVCKCTCGNESIHLSHNLRRSDTISCGCKEIHGYEKDEIVDIITKSRDDKLRLPYRFELEELLDRSKTSVERYIQKYNLYEYINSLSRSRGEEEILKLFPTEAINYRHILKNKQELDILYIEHNIAIEYNGVYWHSTLFKSNNYHQDKTIECSKIGIQLIHIFEHEWNNLDTKRKITDHLSMILDNRNNKVIQARKTIVRKIINEEAIEFCNKYHLQNGIQSEISIGLYDDTILIGVMTFGKPRHTNEFQWELLRVCFKSKTIILGGIGKLFNYFKINYLPKSVVTYIDIAKFTGNTLKNLGFNGEEVTKPNYIWCNSKYIVLDSYQTEKYKLIESGLGTEDETEDEIMGAINYYKIYDSGRLKLVWYKNNIY